MLKRRRSFRALLSNANVCMCNLSSVDTVSLNRCFSNAVARATSNDSAVLTLGFFFEASALSRALRFVGAGKKEQDNCRGVNGALCKVVDASDSSRRCSGSFVLLFLHCQFVNSQCLGVILHFVKVTILANSLYGYVLVHLSLSASNSELLVTMQSSATA